MVTNGVRVVEGDAGMRTMLREGLAQAEYGYPHAILPDIRLPGLDGYEVGRRPKANPTTKPSPALVVTVAADDARKRLA